MMFKIMLMMDEHVNIHPNKKLLCLNNLFELELKKMLYLFKFMFDYEIKF